MRGVRDAKEAFDTMNSVMDEDDNNDGLSGASAKSSGKLAVKSDKSARFWDKESSRIVAEHFKTYIDTDKLPKVCVCGGVLPNKTAKQVQDKVKTFLRQNRRKKAAEASE